MVGSVKLEFSAVIFDLDGVVTKTAALHLKAWKKTFDNLLESLAQKEQKYFDEFTTNDYLKYVDGKPRYQGVESFLKSRKIKLPGGSAKDNTNQNTICGIGNRKNHIFHHLLNQDGVEIYESTLKIIKQLQQENAKLAIATSSKNGTHILEQAGIDSLFNVVIDGVVSAKEQLKGKPEPDIFLKACELMKVQPIDSILVEDAVSGVKAGAKGGFGLTLGIARKNNAEELRLNGADYVISDFDEVKGLYELNNLFLRFRQK